MLAISDGTVSSPEINFKPAQRSRTPGEQTSERFIVNVVQWRKTRLASPHIAVLQRAVALMAESQFVHVALRAAVREDAHAVESSADEQSKLNWADSALRDFSISEVYATYTKAVRDFAITGLKEGQNFAWWMVGKNASVVAKRRKAIERFIEAAIEKGQEVAKAEETFTYRAAVGSYSAVIEKFTVVAETKSSISYLPGTPAGEMVTEKKDGQSHAHFATWAEAHAYLKACSATMLADARRALQIAQSYDGNVRGMKERSRKKTEPVAETPDPPAETVKAVVEVTKAAMTDEQLVAAVPA